MFELFTNACLSPVSHFLICLFLSLQALIDILKQKDVESDAENVIGYLRPFRIIISLLDKPEIGTVWSTEQDRTQTHQNAELLHPPLFVDVSALLLACLPLIMVAFLLRSSGLEQCAVGGGPSLPQLLSGNAWGGNHHQLRALRQPACQVRATDDRTDVRMFTVEYIFN